MRTRSPISTISYNTPVFLRGKLRELTKAGVLEFWCFIVHRPEDDEAGLKEHAHVYMRPNKQVDTSELRELFKEPDPEHDAPKGCLLIRQTKRFDDWALYSVHDSLYLASHHQSRRYHYEFQDFISDDKESLQMLWRLMDRDRLSQYQNMRMSLNAGMDFPEFAEEYHVPIQQIAGYRIAWDSLVKTYTDRNGRIGHDPDGWEDKYDVASFQAVEKGKNIERILWLL